MNLDFGPQAKPARLDAFTGFVFAAFLTIGTYKSLPWVSDLPFDITVLLGTVCVVLMGARFFLTGMLIPHAFWWVLFLFLCFSLGVPLGLETEYGHEKASRLFTLTLLAATFPFFAIQSKEALRRFLEWLGWIGVVLVCIGIFQLVTSSQLDRLEVNDANTISIARVTGISMIVVLCLLQSRKVSLILGTLGVGLMGIVMLATGSRGPVVSFVAIVLVWGVTFFTASLSRMLRLTIFIVVGVLVGALLYPRMPASSAARMEMFVKGEWGNSEQARAMALGRAWDIIPKTPAGIGWGGFDALPMKGAYDDIKYVHNLTVEIFLEGGWLPGVMFILVFLVAAGKSYTLMRANPSFETSAVLLILLYCAMNTLVSGEINDERIFFCFLSIALARAAAPSLVDEKMDKEDLELSWENVSHSGTM